MKGDTEGTPVEKIFTDRAGMQHHHAVHLISQLKKKVNDRNKKPKKTRSLDNPEIILPDLWAGLKVGLPSCLLLL